MHHQMVVRYRWLLMGYGLSWALYGILVLAGFVSEHRTWVSTSLQLVALTLFLVAVAWVYRAREFSVSEAEALEQTLRFPVRMEPDVDVATGAVLAPIRWTALVGPHSPTATATATMETERAAGGQSQPQAGAAIKVLQVPAVRSSSWLLGVAPSSRSGSPGMTRSSVWLPWRRTGSFGSRRMLVREGDSGSLATHDFCVPEDHSADGDRHDDPARGAGAAGGDSDGAASGSDDVTSDMEQMTATCYPPPGEIPLPADDQVNEQQ